MIKGGGGALTREKIVAAVAKTFICIADGSKKVDIWARFRFRWRWYPWLAAHVGREIVKLGGDPVYREGFTTDNGNIILDIHNLDISRPTSGGRAVEQHCGRCDQWPVCSAACGFVVAWY